MNSYIYPFPPNVYSCYRIVKTLIKKEGIMEKISYDRRAYESVNDKSLTLGYISKTEKKKVLGCNGLKFYLTNKGYILEVFYR